MKISIILFFILNIFKIKNLQDLGCFFNPQISNSQQYENLPEQQLQETNVQQLLNQEKGEFTIFTCQIRCALNDYQYAKITLGFQCLCENDNQEYTAVENNYCLQACKIDQNLQNCGGELGYYKVFNLENYKEIIINEMEGVQNQEPLHLGCYIDNQERDLNIFQGTNFTIQSCQEKCKIDNFKYAGLQFYGQCFCGNSYGKYGKSLQQDCNTKCNTSEEYCGGVWRNDIYLVNSEIEDEVQQIINFQDSYKGCYIDQQERDLKNWQNGQYSLQSCLNQCQNQNFLYASVQYYDQCFCDNDYGNYGQVNDSECNLNCNIDLTQICGGIWRNSVYQVDYEIDYSEVIQKKQNQIENYIGCFIDKPDRDLQEQINGSFSITDCFQACKQQQYKYAGLQFYDQCFCGNTFGQYGEVNGMECYLQCNKNQSQLCGGVWRNDIYNIQNINLLQQSDSNIFKFYCYILTVIIMLLI